MQRRDPFHGSPLYFLNCQRTPRSPVPHYILHKVRQVKLTGIFGIVRMSSLGFRGGKSGAEATALWSWPGAKVPCPWLGDLPSLTSPPQTALNSLSQCLI